jgi:hypothetical protein
MLAFAERLGWQMQKQDEALVQQFCERPAARRRRSSPCGFDLLVGLAAGRGGRTVAPGIAGGDGERQALTIYGQRGDGFVERERWMIQIASLLEGLFVVFFHFLVSLTIARLLEGRMDIHSHGI